MLKWEDVSKDLTALTEEDRAVVDLKVKIIGKLIAARKDSQMSQETLGKLSGIKQSMIARLESNRVDAQLTTLLRILSPLGLTLEVVPKK